MTKTMTDTTTALAPSQETALVPTLLEVTPRAPPAHNRLSLEGVVETVSASGTSGSFGVAGTVQPTVPPMIALVGSGHITLTRKFLTRSPWN